MEQLNQSQTYNRNHLSWLGTGIVACLLTLTVISVLDLIKDYKHNSSFFKRQSRQRANMVFAAPETSICPSCSMTVIPCCSDCGSQVSWDSSTGKYYCSICGKTISVVCPECGIPMQPFYQSLPPNGTQLAGSPSITPQSPARSSVGSPAEPDYLMCLSCAYRMLNHPRMPAFNVYCPVCGGNMMRGYINKQ